MVSGRGSYGRGGSGIERGGSSSQHGGDGRTGEKTEAEKVRSDAARLRGSYRYSRYGVAPPPAFSKRESAAYHRRGSSPSAASSSSSSREPPSTAMVVKMEPDDAPAPAFAPGDYLNDVELERLLPKLGEEAGLAPGDFVDERHLDTVIGFVSQTSRREADKAEEWRLVAQEQGKVYVDLGSDAE
ncbi:hypothetical protein ACQ4PT_058800 [Festuca glaucescens]